MLSGAGPWLCPPLTTIEYNTFCTSGFVDDVIFSHNGPYHTWRWQCLLGRRVRASSHKFPTYSPGGATLFDYDVIHSGSKLHTRGVSDHDIRGASIGWWPAVCRIIKVGGKVCCLRLPYYHYYCYCYKRNFVACSLKTSKALNNQEITSASAGLQDENPTIRPYATAPSPIPTAPLRFLYSSSRN